MPPKLPHFRALQLIITSGRVLREKGGFTLAARLIAWLRGERGYHRQLKPNFISYSQYVRRTSPTPEVLQTQTRSSRLWNDTPRIELMILDADATIDRTLQSLFSQSYPYWHLSLFCSSSIQVDDERVSVHLTEQSTAERVQSVFEQSSADLSAFVTCGDCLGDNALYEVAACFRKSANTDILYSDLDYWDPLENRWHPLFKPDWSPVMMLSFNLLEHLGVFRRELLLKILRDFPRASTINMWGLALHASTFARQIVHCPQVLYHRFSLPQRSYYEDARPSLLQYLAQNDLQQPDVNVVYGENPFTTHFHCKWEIKESVKVSVIIPSRDHALILSACLESLFTLTTHKSYEVIVVDTGSTEPETFALYASYDNNSQFRVIYDQQKFNFSRVCNVGAKSAIGDILLFLNNDTKVLVPDWLQLMLQWFELPMVGAVGAKLLYPNGTIQHAGVIVGVNNLADNFLPHMPENCMTIFGSDSWYRNFLAVTGACLMIPRKLFWKVNGFDEKYLLNFSDVQLCLDLVSHGYQVVYTPQVRLVHHESLTHRHNIPPQDTDLAYQRFASWVARGDPYFNPNLDQTSSRPTLPRKLTPAVTPSTRLTALENREYDASLPD